MSSTLPNSAPLPSHPAVFSTGAVAEVLGIDPWTIRRVVQRRMVPSVQRLRTGSYCIWSAANIAELVDALKRAGYLDGDAPIPNLAIVDQTAAALDKLVRPRVKEASNE